MSDPTSNNQKSPDNAPGKDVSQRFGRSLDFWLSGKEDYPPAIRGVVADIDDLPTDVQELIQKIARDKRFPDLELQRLLWFEDKNEKLDEACEDARQAFRPFASNADGLINTNPLTNPLLEQPTRHRLVVADKFAVENYDRSDEQNIALDAEVSLSGPIDEKSWKRKITQTLKPWSVRKEGRLEPARPADDLLLALNELFNRTQHGWLVVDLFKLRERRGAILTYARTFEYQRKGTQAFEFKVEMFGVAKELTRFEPLLANVGCVYVETDEDGQFYLTKASVYVDKDASSIGARKPICVETQIELQAGKPSQLRLIPSGAFYETNLKPLVIPGKRTTHKIDLRQLSGDQAARFHLQVKLNAPLLIATSGDAIIFQLDDLLTRFTSKNLAALRT